MDLLRCPHCNEALHRQDRVWRCARGHSFDVARQGYVNLLTGRRVHRGDTADMLDARSAVLAAGHLDVVTEAAVEACRDAPSAGALVEVGAGTAHHLARVRRALGHRHAVALDASAAAGRRAARVDPEWTTAVVADVWQPWPLLDGVAAAVLKVFAPRNFSEAARVLAPQGRLVVVVPAADHLAELVGPLGLLTVDPRKADRVLADAAGAFDLLHVSERRTTRRLRRDEAAAIALMGPAAHHRTRAELLARAAGLPEVGAVTVAFWVLELLPR